MAKSAAFLLVLACAAPVFAADSILNLSALVPVNQYQYTPNPTFSPTAINDVGQVLGTFGYVLSPGFGTTYEPVLYSNGTVTNWGAPGNGAILTSLNNAGEAVGSAAYRDQLSQAIAYSGGTFSTIGPTTNIIFSDAYGINNSGQIAGQYWTTNLPYIHAFVSSNGDFKDLGTLGGTYSAAGAINDNGEIAGVSTNAAGQQHLFSYFANHMTDLGAVGGGDSIVTVTGINSAGDITGFYTSQTSSAEMGFVDAGGKISYIFSLGDQGSIVTGINNSGEVVGTSYTNSGSYAFLDFHGVMTDLNTLLPADSGWDLTSAAAINDLGQIVGTGTFDGQSDGFLLSIAAPEPQSLILLMMGLLFCGIVRCKHCRRH